MAINLIMGLCLLPCVVIMYFSLRLEGRIRDDMLFGVSLWEGAEEKPEVAKIRKNFYRAMDMLLLLCIVLFLLTCLPGRDSVCLSLQMLYVLFIIVVFFFPVVWSNKKMKLVKRADRAYREPRHQCVYVDIQAAAEPTGSPFQKLSVLGMVCGFLPVAVELFWVREAFYGWWDVLILAVMGLVGPVLFWMQRCFWKLRTEVVSDSSELNIALSAFKRKKWSGFWCISIWNNVLLTGILWGALHYQKMGAIGTTFLILGGSFLFTLIEVAAAVVTENRIQREYGKYAVSRVQPSEEDDYWIGGIFYYNKDDDHLMVNRRGGIGTTVNLAKPSGKICSLVVVIATAVMLIGVSIWILLDDFVPVTLSVQQENVVSAQYKEEYRLAFSDISKAELLEELPHMSKSVGTAMEYIYKGTFSTRDDGKYKYCKVCVRTQEPPFIRLTDRNGKVYFLNDESPEQTREVFRQIQEYMEG